MKKNEDLYQTAAQSSALGFRPYKSSAIRSFQNICLECNYLLVLVKAINLTKCKWILSETFVRASMIR